MMTRLILVLILIGAAPSLVAQNRVSDPRSSLFGSSTNPKEHHYSQAEADKPTQIIVTLKDKPLFEQLQISNTKSQRYTTRNGSGIQPTGNIGYVIQSYTQTLKTSQTAAISSLKTNKLIQSSGRRFKSVVNGFVAQAKPKDFDRIRSLPTVDNLYVDRRVSIHLADSVEQIGASSAWSLLDSQDRPIMGQGIKVAVIDTGIDYNHPDLGGCLGEGCKVIDGYDFVNGDPDPMDDNFHGTHVAGIVAANGAVKGVAPDATLLAYKTMDADGFGMSSDIIAAIERAVDPDQDPATADAVDVINLSLGGFAFSPISQDPLVQAVEQAVQAGVVVVVSAGNDGTFNRYGTVSSPGIAPSAITVAAVDKKGELADFSSWGNTPFEFAENHSGLKPEISAPGVNIISTSLDGAHESASGTSMAAPHIAGAAALLLQNNPELSPGEIKSLLMTSAAPSSLDPYQFGSGMVDIMAALDTKLLLEPAALNFGYIENEEGETHRTLDLTLTNVSGEDLDLSPGTLGALDTNASLDFSNFPETIPANSTLSTSVALTMNSSQVPYLAQIGEPYFSKLLIDMGAQDSVVPIAFNRAEILTIKETGLGPGFKDLYGHIFVDGKNRSFSKSVDNSDSEIVLSMALRGTENATVFVSDVNGRFFARTGISTLNNDVVEFTPSEGGVKPPEILNIDGEVLPFSEQTLRISLEKDNQIKIQTGYGGNITFGSLIDISDQFQIDYYATARDPSTTDTDVPLYLFGDSMLGSNRAFNYSLDLLQKNQLLINRSGWERRAVNVEAFNASYTKEGYTDWSFSPHSDIPPRTAPFIISINSVVAPGVDSPLFSLFHFMDYSDDDEFGKLLGDSYEMKFGNGVYKKFRSNSEGPHGEHLIMERSDSFILWGLGPKFWALGGAIKEGDLRLFPDVNGQAGNSAILDSWANTYNIETPFQVSCLDDGGILSESETLTDAKLGIYPNGCDKLQFSANYIHTLDNMDYTSEVELEINTSELSETPRISLLELVNGGVIDHYVSHPDSHLNFYAIADAGIDQVSVDIKYGEGAWETLPVSRSEQKFTAPIRVPEGTTVAALRLVLTDNAGNLHRSTINGAFLVGSEVPEILDSDGDGWVDSDDAFRFDPNKWVGADIQADATPLSLEHLVLESGASNIVVQRFQLQVASPFSELSSLSLEALGTGNDAEMVRNVSLYVDRNQNGTRDEEDLLLAEGVFAEDDGSLNFKFEKPFALPEGITEFLVTYDF